MGVVVKSQNWDVEFKVMLLSLWFKASLGYETFILSAHLST